MATYNAKKLTITKFNETTQETDQYIIDPMQGNEAAYFDINVTIAANAWTSSNGTYSYTWSNTHLTANSAVFVTFKNGVRGGLVGDLNFTKTTGSVTFTTNEQPIGDIPLTVRIIDANVDGVFPISADMIETNAIVGETNVEGALEDLDSRVSAKADKSDTVLETTLSRGRKANTTVGTGSVALGDNVEAKGDYSHAEGSNTHTLGKYSHAEGYNTLAGGWYSHAEGNTTVCYGQITHVAGRFNVQDIPSWRSGTSYALYDIVVYNGVVYRCVTANSDETFVTSNWQEYSANSNYVEIIGNGTPIARSNARSLDWNGNECLKGDLYVNCNADSTGGTALGAAVASNAEAIGNLASLTTTEKGSLVGAANELNSKLTVVSSGSLHDIKASGAYYLTNAVTDKPSSTGGSYVVGSNGTAVGGIFTQNSTGNTYAIRYDGSTWTYEQLALNDKIAKQQYTKQYTSDTLTLATVQADAEALAGDAVGDFHVGYANATASEALGIGIDAEAYNIILIKHSSTRMGLLFIGIAFGYIYYNAKVGNTWDTTLKKIGAQRIGINLYNSYADFFDTADTGFSTCLISKTASDAISDYSGISPYAVQLKYNASYGVQITCAGSKEPMFIRRKNAGTWTNWTKVSIDDSALVHLAGDETITGNKTFTQNVNISKGKVVHVISNAIDLTQANNGTSSDSNFPFAASFDKNDNLIAQYGSYALADGKTEGRITVSNVKSNGTLVYNTLRLRVDKNGNRSYAIADPAAFRTALDMKDMDNFGTFTNCLFYGVTGIITSSGTRATLYIPIFEVTSITSVTFTKVLAMIRTVPGGYLGGSSGVDLTSYITSVSIQQWQGLIVLILDNTSGWGITNNTVLCGELKCNVTIA